MEQPFNIWRLVLIVGFLGALLYVIWRSFRPSKQELIRCPSCTGEGRVFLEEHGEDEYTRFHYQCSCRNIWTIERRFEKPEMNPTAN